MYLLQSREQLSGQLLLNSQDLGGVKALINLNWS